MRLPNFQSLETNCAGPQTWVLKLLVGYPSRHVSILSSLKRWIRPSCHSSSAKDINYHWLFWTSDRTSIINLVTLVPVFDYCLVNSRVQPCFGFLCSRLSANERVTLQPRRDPAFPKRMRQSAIASELNDAYLNLSHHRIPKNASQDGWFHLNHCLNEVTLRFLVWPSGFHFTMLSNEWNRSFGFFSHLEGI